MMAKAKPVKKDFQESYIPYSDWSKDIIKRISQLSDECLDRYKEDKKINIEILKMLSKLRSIVEKKYYQK